MLTSSHKTSITGWKNGDPAPSQEASSGSHYRRGLKSCDCTLGALGSDSRFRANDHWFWLADRTTICFASVDRTEQIALFTAFDETNKRKQLDMN